MNTKEYIKRVMEENNKKLIEYSDNKLTYNGNIIFPNSSAQAGFTPVGTVISVMGVSAPTNYLACNGQIVNITDYPELANYFEQQFGSKNKFGGDGTTTFAVPDLRGEFLRGTGTNSHANQGSGAAVGVHQDGTIFPRYAISGKYSYLQFIAEKNNEYQYIENGDSSYSSTTTKYVNDIKNFTNYAEDNDYAVTVRPTNTSVLYCIATKNIYIDARFDYSLDEKVVGTWIDGKPLYQKTYNITSYNSLSQGDTNISLSLSNIDNFWMENGEIHRMDGDNEVGYKLNYTMPTWNSWSTINVIQIGRLIKNADSTLRLQIRLSKDLSTIKHILVTVCYTKTID